MRDELDIFMAGSRMLDERLSERRVPAIKVGQFFDRQGEPMSVEEWAQKIDDIGYRLLEEDGLLDGDVWISTVWVGFDPLLFGEGPGRIFETLITRRAGDDSTTYRSRTEAKAREFHGFMVAQYRELEERRAREQAAGRRIVN